MYRKQHLIKILLLCSQFTHFAKTLSRCMIIESCNSLICVQKQVSARYVIVCQKSGWITGSLRDFCFLLTPFLLLPTGHSPIRTLLLPDSKNTHPGVDRSFGINNSASVLKDKIKKGKKIQWSYLSDCCQVLWATWPPHRKLKRHFTWQWSDMAKPMETFMESYRGRRTNPWIKLGNCRLLFMLNS